MNLNQIVPKVCDWKGLNVIQGDGLEILFIANVPRPYGGVATHSWHLLSKLSQAGLVIHFLDTKPRPKKEVPSRVRFYTFPTNTFSILKPLMQFLLRHPLHFLRILRFPIKDIAKMVIVWERARSILLANPRIQIIHAQHAYDRGYVSALLKQEFAKKLVVTIHGAEITKPELFARWKRNIKFATVNADEVITVSKYTQQNIIAAFPSLAQKCIIIPNGVDQKHFKSGTFPRKQEILITGDIHVRKGVDVLFEAFHSLDAKDWTLTYIGTAGNAYEDLKNRIAKSGLSKRVKIRLNISQEELIDAYSEAAIFVFPTNDTTEGFGLVALEAMASGLAVVASDIAAIPEIVINNETGLLVEAGNVRELAQALESLMTSPNLRQKLIEGAFQRLDLYDWGNISQIYVDRYLLLAQNV